MCHTYFCIHAGDTASLKLCLIMYKANGLSIYESSIQRFSANILKIEILSTRLVPVVQPNCRFTEAYHPVECLFCGRVLGTCSTSDGHPQFQKKYSSCIANCLFDQKSPDQGTSSFPGCSCLNASKRTWQSQAT